MKPKKVYTLCVIRHHSKVLLGIKKRGFKTGFLNGYGGKVRKNEKPRSGLRREVREEVGLLIIQAKFLGIMTFDYPEEIMEVHLFYVDQFSGIPTESKEMKPQWFRIDQIPFNQMLSDAKYWMPCALEQIPFTAEFILDENHQITDHKIITIGS